MNGRQTGPDRRAEATVSVDSAALVDAFLTEKRQRTGSERTAGEYRRYLRQFLLPDVDLAKVSPLDVHRFAYAPRVDGARTSPSTVGVRLAAIGGFLDFAVRMRAIDTNPALEVHRPRPRPSVPRGLSRAEVRRLLDVIPETAIGLRDRAMIITSLLTGLRRAELVDLRPSDLAGTNPTIIRVRVKGGAVRVRDLPRPAAIAVETALRARRPGAGPAADERLFGLTASGWYARLRRHGEAAGIVGLSPHVLRHSAAKLRREAGAPIEDIAALLGHASIATTATYLARLEGERDDGWAALLPGLGLASDGSDRDPDAPPRSMRRVVASRGRTAGQRINRSGGRCHAHPISRIGGQHRAPLPRSNSSR